MQNESYSLMHGADSGGDRAMPNALSVSTDLLQQLQQDNARLPTVVAHLLLKNQTLRWQLGGQQSLDMPVPSVAENERTT